MHWNGLNRTVAVAAMLLAAAGGAAAQDASGNTGGYRQPPAPISQILDAQSAPMVSFSPDARVMAQYGRSDLPTIADLSEPELRLAGVRLNPRTNAPSRGGAYTSIAFVDVEKGTRREVRLPEGARFAFPQWSPDGSKVAFALAATPGLELWVADVATGQARKLSEPFLNASLGSPFDWAPGGTALLVKRIPAGRGAAPAMPTVPGGPIIQENSGRAAAARTYQDLLATPHDEKLFEHYFTSQLALVPVAGGAAEAIGAPGIISNFSMAPNGEYVRIDRVKRPFSYVVPFNQFASATEIIDRQGRVVRTMVDKKEVTPSPIGRDVVLPGARFISWRADAPATLVWAEAADGGNPRSNSAVRDRVLTLDAPFTGQPRTLAELDQRFGGITWGRNDVALLNTRWSTSARIKTYVINPSQPGAMRLLWDRSSEDRYNDPGSPMTTTNAAGFRVLRFTPDGASIFLTGEGASAKGIFPFLDRLQLADGRATRLWQAKDPYYETPATLADAAGTRLITRRESVSEAPNYFVRDLKKGNARALTRFTDQAPQLAGIQRQVITYPRADGVMLSATLFTPPGYNARRDGPLPMLMWAYPREFRDADAASQITDSPNRFSRPSGASHLFLLTQGYAVLDGPAMPIIGEGDVEPNDSYIEQLVSSAQAAVDKVVAMGVADRDRIGVGGHSYGAFMTANLLAHSDLFRAGIARSGAYNRTLTPFGFQAEPRTYWQAQEVYNRMSPFNYADKLNEPILLIHGEADDNSGTFPVQSERLFAALQGHGATVRYVVLPHEAHGYAARESVGHTLAEMVGWMDRYVKNAPKRTTGPAASAK